MKYLTRHFSLEEFLFSQTAARRGIDNTPDEIAMIHLLTTAQSMEEVRALLGNPIKITSGYRSQALNSAIGGANTSAHMEGWAADFICPGFGRPIEIVREIAASPIRFDQCIQEGNWVHISFAPANRRQLLTAHFGPEGTTYSRGVSESVTHG